VATPTVTPTPSPTPTQAPTATPAATATPKPTKAPKPTEAETTPTPSLSKVTYYSNLIGFELTDGTLKNYNLAKSTEFDGLKSSKVAYVYFGGYPTNLVESESTKKNLSKASADSKNVIEYGGTKYMKIDYMQSSTQTDTLYYRYAPIKWRVLSSSKSELVLISDQVIDFYEYSGLSNWLTSSFKSAALSSTEKKILVDDVTFLTADEVSKYSKLNVQTDITNYAQMRKNYGRGNYNNYVVAMWWLKSSSGTPYIDGSGSIMTGGMDSSSRQGVRPVIKIKLQ
jgi:hypothetical protein